MAELRWTKAKAGAIFGVCKGLAKSLDAPVGIIRLVWICSVLLGGIGLGIYLLLAIALPREDKVDQAWQPKILGVCAEISKKFDLEIGIVRFLMLAMFCASLGLTSILYVAGYFGGLTVKQTT